MVFESGNYVSSIALIWTSYIFLFAEGDRVLVNLLSRIKQVLSTNSQGEFDLNQKEAKSNLTAVEIRQIAPLITGDEFKQRIIYKYLRTYDEFRLVKGALIVYLFFVTLLVLIQYNTNLMAYSYSIEENIIIGIFLGLIFYIFIQFHSEDSYIKYYKNSR